MEILIPGLILVALMVWLSTRIKRNAAAAFDAERIETEDLIVEKPEGFLHVLNDDSGLLFRAYSKDFGMVGRRDMRQATIEVERHRGSTLDDAVAATKGVAETFTSETPYTEDGERAVDARSTRIRDGGEFQIVHKFVTRGSDVIEARGAVLTENRDDHMSDIEQAIGTLRIR
jgi:hypothetical protein